MQKPPTTTANHNRPPSTTSGTTTHHHQRNCPSSNDHKQRHLRNTTTNGTPSTPCTSDNRAPPTFANFQRSHTSYHRAPPTTAHLQPLLRYSINSKQITHIHSSSIFIIPLIFIRHPPHLK